MDSCGTDETGTTWGYAILDKTQEDRNVTDKCEWVEDDEGNFETSCGEMFTFADGTPSDNAMKFCCYCGKELSEKPYVEPEDEDE